MCYCRFSERVFSWQFGVVVRGCENESEQCYSCRPTFHFVAGVTYTVLKQCIGSGSSATLSSDMLWIEVWLLLRAPRHVWYCSVPVGPSLLTSHATTTSLLTSDSTACLPMYLLWVCVYVTVPLESVLLFPVSTDSRGMGVGVGVTGVPGVYCLCTCSSDDSACFLCTFRQWVKVSVNKHTCVPDRRECGCTWGTLVCIHAAMTV